MSGKWAYLVGAGVALGTALLQLWMNLAVGIVGSADNPVNQGFYGVVVAAAACAFTARGLAGGMARAMLATAGVQAVLGLAVATAPANAPEAGGAAMLSAGFAALWLVAAGCFHRAAAMEARAA